VGCKAYFDLGIFLRWLLILAKNRGSSTQEKECLATIDGSIANRDALNKWHVADSNPPGPALLLLVPLDTVTGERAFALSLYIGLR
jgi:hypothetical protein